MILFDPKAKGVSNAGTKKLNNKTQTARSAKFSASKTLPETSSNCDISEVADVAPMLFLQEVDERQHDQQELEEFAEKAFKGLKDLQLALLNNQLNERHLLNLQHALQKKHKFITPELKALAEEIEIRIEVEIAKLESSRN